MKTMITPDALKEVWEWKEMCYEESKGMTIAEYMKRIHENADRILVDAGLMPYKEASEKSL